MSLCTKRNREELRNGKCPDCDFWIPTRFSRDEELRRDRGEGIHEKCGYPIVRGKCTHCD